MNHLINNRLLYHPLSWVLFYLTIHFLVRVGFSQTLQVDDAEQIHHAQQLALGYPIPQPPLYSWISWGLFQIMGTGLLALTLLKYSLIALPFWLTWIVSGYLFIHTQTRWLATSAYLLMPSFAWHMHQGFTHTILLGFAIILTLHALLRFHHTQSNFNILYLGAAIAIGLMSKYSFLLFVILLAAAALTIPSFRKPLLTRQGVLLFIPLTLLTLPHLGWLLEHQQEVFNAIDNKLKVSSEHLLLERLDSLRQFTVAAIAFVTPFSLLYLLIARKRLLPSKEAKNLPDTHQLLNRFYLLLITITVLLALFISMPHFKVRWFHPLMMIFPLWMLAWIEREEPFSQTKIRWIAGLTLLITLLILGIRLLQVTIGPEIGKYGRLNRPIVESLEQLPDHLKQQSVLITTDHFLAAHLLSHYPQHAIVFNQEIFHIDQLSRSKQCLYLWDDDTLLEPPILAGVDKQGTLKTKVGPIVYTLSYARSDRESCPPFMR